MALYDKKQGLNNQGGIDNGKGGNQSKPIEKEKTAPKEEIRDSSGFGGKPYVTGGQFNSWVRNPNRFNETKVPRAEREKIGKELGKQFGTYVQKGETGRVLKGLQKEKSRTLNQKARTEIDHKIKVLKNFLGKK